MGNIERILYLTLMLYVQNVHAHETDDEVVGQMDPNESRCFQFTWLGPKYDNQSVFLNATCNEATRLADGIPCFPPLVVSDNRTWPDIEYIWTHHFNDTTCVLTQSDVCAQFTYYFDDHPENSTYMCTRAVNANNTIIKSGCFEETSGSYRKKVCFCNSIKGGMPCNNGYGVIPSMCVALLMGFIAILYQN